MTLQCNADEYLLQHHAVINAWSPYHGAKIGVEAHTYFTLRAGLIWYHFDMLDSLGLFPEESSIMRVQSEDHH